MICCSPKEAVRETQVGMGQAAVTQAPGRLRSVLGSCIGVALYHARTRTGALAHVILPDSQGHPPATPGKFADTAVPHLLKLLASAGAHPRELVAKIAGGANMFGHTGPLQIGDANAAAVDRALKAIGVRLVGKDAGGAPGRRVDCATGELLIEIAGEAPRVL
jgi:chemotaxis protein CheD